MDIETFREGMSVVDNYCYLNHAALGPIHNDVLSELQKLSNLQINGGVNLPYDHMDDGFKVAREPIANLLNCKIEEIALTTTTSQGIATVLDSMNWSNPSEKGIIIDDLEFISNSFAYQQIEKKFGVKLHIVRNKNGVFDIADFETILKSNSISLVGLSHVQFINGFKSNLTQLHSMLQRNGAYLLVDAIQSCGAVNLQSNQADFIAVGAYKWCLGPLTTGFLYINHDLQKQLEPVYVSASSDVNALDFLHHPFNPHQDARKFQPFINTNNLALGKAIELLNAVGITAIENQNFKLTDYLVERLETISGVKIDSNRELEHKSSIIRVVLEQQSNKLQSIVKILSEKYKIVVSFRAGGIRISPHFYNTFDEIDKFITTFKSLIEL